METFELSEGEWMLTGRAKDDEPVSIRPLLADRHPTRYLDTPRWASDRQGAHGREGERTRRETRAFPNGHSVAFPGSPEGPVAGIADETGP